MPVDLNKWRTEVESGLPTESERIDAAEEKLAFFNFDGFRYERRFRRDAESSFDYQGRSHRGSGFLNECVTKLCEHTYSPGPVRRWSVSAGDDFLQQVYTDNLIDAVMLDADEQSTLNDCCAIQIDAAEGTPDKPITYRLWGREQLAVWCDPDNANIPQVVVTIDKSDNQKRFRLWSDTEVWTFMTKRVEPLQTAGGQVAYLRNKEEHDYGCLPFSFIHYRLPIRGYDLVVGIGEFLFKAEVAIDDRLFRLDESIHKHLNPIPWAKGMPDQWKPILEPQRFIRLPSANPRITPSGGFEPGEYAEIGYVQVNIDVAAAWEDLNNYIQQALDAASLPKSAIRMEAMGVASGISLIVEQEPLIKRAEKRRRMFDVYECDLGERTLTCAGNHYGRGELLTAAKNGELRTIWPQPTIAVNTPDKLEMLVSEIQAGMMSHLMGLQEWHDISRDEALELMKQIAQDQKDIEAANPALRAVNMPQPPPDEEGPAGDAEANGQPVSANAEED